MTQTATVVIGDTVVQFETIVITADDVRENAEILSVILSDRQATSAGQTVKRLTEKGDVGKATIARKAMRNHIMTPRAVRAAVERIRRNEAQARLNALEALIASGDFDGAKALISQQTAH